MPCTPGLWCHTTKLTTFTLALDDFGIKLFTKANLNHLLNALQQYYTISVDTTGYYYCGLNIKWKYDKGYVDIYIPGYVQKSLQKNQHMLSKKAQYAPHAWTTPAYDQKIQYALLPASLPVLNKARTKRVQAITGTYQYYTKAIDLTMIAALNKMASQQSA